jgi:hypothetical protein
MNNYELNLDTDYIENATVALIREYLARKVNKINKRIKNFKLY